MAGKGRPKTGGRQKGTLNKTSALLKDAVLEAADSAGGKEGLVVYLVLQARENSVAFLGLLGKLIPSQIAAEVTQSVATVTAEMMTSKEWANLAGNDLRDEIAESLTASELEEAQALSSACLKKKYEACWEMWLRIETVGSNHE